MALLGTGTKQPEAMALCESTGWTPIPNDGRYAEVSWSRCFERSLPGS